MLKKSMITAAAALAIATGATALQSSPAEAGVTIQLVHGGGYGLGPGWGYQAYRGYNGYRHHEGYRGHRYGPRWGHRGYRQGPRGPRFGQGYYGSYYGEGPTCFTTYKKVKVKRWSEHKRRMVRKKIRQPVTICR